MSHRVTILHTNDFHNHLSAAQAETIRRVRDECGPDTVLVDAGDAISAGNIGFRAGGEPILTLMSETGYDCMTMGNREFHIADALLRLKIGNARFPVLCGNMRYKGEASAGDGKPLPVEPYIVRILPSGIRVGIVGATVPMVTERMSARHVSAFLFDDPVGEIRRIAAALRPDVDLLIALTHIGIKADELLAQSCPDLDLLVTGHTHLVVRSGDRLEGAPIVQAGWFARFLGKVVFEAGAGRARIVESEIVPLEPANR